MKKSEIIDLLNVLELRQRLLMGRVAAEEEKTNDIQARVAILQEWRRKQEDKAKVTVSSQWPAFTTTYPINGGGSVTATFQARPMYLSAEQAVILRDLRDRIRGAGGSSDKHQGALLDECLEVLDQIFGGEA